MNKKLMKQAKEAVLLSRKNGRILDVSEAFKKYPAENEIHESKLQHFKREDNKEEKQ